MLDNLPRVFSLQEIVLHNLAKIFWRTHIVRTSNTHGFYRFDIEELAAIREPIEDSISEGILLPGLPTKFRDLLQKALIELQRGFSEAIAWDTWCGRNISFYVLNPLTAGPYAAEYFITPAGQFDDSAWAKHFVVDGHQPILHRFRVACFYCFEVILIDLWHIIKANSELNCEGRETSLSMSRQGLDTLWIFRLEKGDRELTDCDFRYQGSFHFCGLNEAVGTNNEPAARYFWELCSENDRAKFLSEFSYNTLTNASMTNQVNIIFFIYTLLSVDQKKYLIRLTVHRRELSAIWFCLFQSPKYTYIINDLLTFPHHIPSKFYERIFSSILDLIEAFKIPLHIKIFKTIWNNLSEKQKKGVFKTSGYMICTMVDMELIDLLETVIHSLSCDVKENLLFEPWFGVKGMYPFQKFFQNGNHDYSLRFLLIFLTDLDPVTQKQIVRPDAGDILQRFIASKTFSDWMDKKCTREERKQVHNILESVKASLGVLDYLLS